MSNDKYITIISRLPLPDFIKDTLVQNIDTIDKNKLNSILKKYWFSLQNTKLYNFEKNQFRRALSNYHILKSEINEKNNMDSLLEDI